MGRTEERIGVILDIKGDVNKIKSSIGSLQKDLLGVQLPKGLGKDFETRMRRLSDEIENFEKMASKAGSSFEGAKQIDASYKKILDYARKVEISFSAIKKEANLDTSKFFPKEIIQRIEKAEEAFQRYEKAIEKGDEALQKQKKSLKEIEAALVKNENKRAELASKRDAKKASYDKISSEQGKIKTTKSNELAQEQKNLEVLKQKKIALDAEKAAVEALAKKKEALEKSEKAYASRKEQYGAKDSKAKAEKQVLNINKKAYEEAEQAVKKYGNTVRSIEDIELDQSKTTSSIEATKTAIKGLGKEIDSADDKIKKAQNAFDAAAQDLKENETAANSLSTQMKTLKTTIEQAENAAKAKGLKELVKSLDEIGVKIDPATSSLEDIQKTINNLKPDAIKAIADALDKAGVNLDELDVDLTKLGQKNNVFQEGAKGAREMNNQLDQLKGHVQQFFSLTNSVMLFRRGIRQAFDAIKELDKAMTETAVVTDFSVGDMWKDLPRYTKVANDLGTTTLGAYQTMTLFYQQGLKTNEAFAIGTETMKMARIAGLEYKDATDLMTAALRGFNMELNESSAQKINDVYSKLAAITAADTQEIANAMTKTASIASSANMEFETTAALLSQIIETTREPAETAGTAMKTIIARFTEMKKATSDIIDVEGETINVNKVEAALRTAGVALRDANGEFRDLDDVFLELSSKWNGLDMMTQRYIATMAAGSRQQSRFIAMMQDYERTMELVDAAYNSSGASQKQFEKTQESLETKLNKLKNAWNEFLMGIGDSKLIKAGVDALTLLLKIVNKLTGNSGLLKLGAAIGALKGGNAIFNGLFKMISPLKKGMGKQGEEAAKNLLQAFTQRINNYNNGKGFVIDIDIGKKGIAGLKNKFNDIKRDFKALQNVATTPMIRKDSILTLEQIDGKIVATGMTTSGVTKKINGELSQTTLQALAASEGVEEIGEDFTKTGINGKAALDIIQKEYLETIALAEALDKANDGESIEFDGEVIQGSFTANANSRQYWKGRGEVLEKDMGTLQASGASFLQSFKSLLPILAKIAVVIGAIAAVAYTLYNSSSLKQIRNELETVEGALEDCDRALEKSSKTAEAFGKILSEIGQRETVFENLIEGNAEWYQAISETNEVLLEQIELLKTLGYDIGYSYDENGMIQVDNEAELRQAQKEAEQQRIEQQKRKTALTAAKEVTTLEADLLRKNSENSKDNFWTEYGDRVAKKAANNANQSIEAPFGTAVASMNSENNVGMFDGEVVGQLLAEMFSPELSSEDLSQLNTQAQQSMAQIWATYADNPIDKKAGQKVIKAMGETAYDTFFGDGLEKEFNNLGLKTNNFANPELEFSNGKDIKRKDLDDVLVKLGYGDEETGADWSAAAQDLGLNYDAEVGGYAGLYALDGDGKKKYLDVSNHGKIDSAQEFSELLEDPSGKNIDAGYLALRLAQQKRGSYGVEAMENALPEGYSMSNILYGTEDWNTEITASKDSDEITKAMVELINEANAEKEQIATDLKNITVSKKDSKEVSKLLTGDEVGFDSFVSEIQKISVDANQATAEAYKTFITSRFAAAQERGSNQSLEDIKKTYDGLFDGIDLSNTLETINTLNQKIADGVLGAQELKDALSSSGSFNLTDAFTELNTSGVLDQLGEDIAKLSDEAGNIDVTATRELVDSNSQLKTVMDEFNVSGYAMGKILTDIQNGEITLTSVNEGLIESYKTLYSAMGQAEDVLYDLRNADLGEDYTEIGRTYEERYDTIKDLYDRKAYGSENFGGNIKSLIGDSEWQKYLDNNGGNAKTAWEKVSSDYKLGKNNGNLYGSFSSLVSSKKNDIFSNQNGKISYDLSGFENYDAVLDHMVSSFGVSREYAKAMLADMSTYSATLQEDLNKLNAVANANMAYSKMYHVNDANGKTTASYTNMSDAEIRTTFKDTNQWKEAEKAAAKKEGYDKLDADGQTKAVIESFKELNNIINTITDEGKERKIDKVDSQGNKFYKDDENNVKMSKSDNFEEIEVALDFSGGAEEDLKEIQRLTEDEQVIQAATELSDEEFQAWIAEYTGNEAVYQAMIDAGITPQSLASVAAAKEEMITQIQAVAQALETLEVTIPINMDGFESTLTVLGIPIPIALNPVNTKVTVGGKGSKASFVKSSGTGGTSGTGSNKYTAPTGSGNGTGYDGGHDYRNSPNNGGGGGGNNEKNDTNPKLENISNKLENLERQYENKEIGALEYETKKRNLLTQQKDTLAADIKKDYANSKYKDYFYYDKASDSYLLNEAKFNKANDATKNAIMEDYERINGKNDDLNEIEDLLKELVKNTKYDTSNEKAKLEYLDKDVKNNRIDLSTHSSEQRTLLTSEIDKLTKQFTEEFNNSANKDMFVYDEASGQLLLNEEKLLELSEEEQKTVKEEWEYLKGIVDEASDLQDTLDEMVDKYSSANEEATLDYLNWLKENGLISVEEYDKAVKAEEQAIAANALADFLERIETDKNFESGLLYRDENTGMVEINQEMYKGLNATDQKEALNLQKTLNDLFLTYLKNSGEGEKQGNQFDTTNQDTKLEEIERQRSKGNLGATAYTKSRNKELNDKYDNLSATFQKELNESKNKDMFTYDETTGELLLNMEKFNQLTEASQEEVKQEYETLKGITNEMKGIEDILEDINYGKYSTHNQQEQQTWEDYRYNNDYSSAGDYNKRSQKNEEEEIDILSRKADAYDVTDEYVEAGKIAQDKNGKYYIVDEAWYNGLGKEQQKAVRQNIRFYNKALDEDLKEGRIGQDEKGNYVVKDQDWFKGLSEKEQQRVKNRLYAYNKAPSKGYIDPDILSGDLIYDPVTGQVSVNYEKGEREQWDTPTTQALEQKASGINADNIRNQSLKDKVEERKKTDKYDTAQIDRDLQDLERKYANGEMSPFEYSKQWRELQEKKVYNNRQQAGKALINELYDQNWDYVFENGQWTYKTKDGVELTDDQKAEAAAAAQLLNNNDSDKWDYNAETGRFEFTKDWDKDLTEEQKEEQQKLLEDANKNIGADPNSIYWTYNPDTGEIDFTDTFFALDDDSQTSILQDLEEKYGYSELMKEAIDVLKDPDYKVAGNRERDQAANARRSNISSDMDSLSRREQELAQYNNLISKLPQEVQGPLTLMTSAASMAFNAERSQLLRAEEATVRENMAVAKSENDWLFNQTDENGNKLEYVYWDEATDSWKKNEELWGKLAPEVIDDAEAAFNELDGFAKEINNIKAQRGDTIFQKPFYMAEDAVEDMQRAFDSTTSITDGVNKAFDVLAKKLGLSSKAFDNLEGLIGDYLESKGITDDSTMSGLNWINEQQFGEIKNSKLWEYMGEDTKKFFEMAFVQDDDGFLVKDFISSAFGTSGELFGFTGDLLNPEMLGIGLDMLNTTKGMIDQAKQWVEKIIGYITQATQVLVDAWTNREDYLYNFLKQIEKHLQEYENLQRYSTQIEKGRIASADDILNNWNKRWASLQQQLEEQTERLEERQEELNRSRWNPFKYISGWDPTSDTLYENREVKMLWDIVMGLGQSFNLMGTGAIFSQINQLYEDYDSRVQNAYEDRLVAEQALLDIEDERLDLVKAGADETTQFEQKVLDAFMRKEQEQIDELSRLNDSVTQANQKLLSTLQDNLDKIRQDRENEKKEEELGEKERRLAYLRQDTSGANALEIKKLEEELDEQHEDYTDTLIDQKISELEKQNELAAEQRQQQIDLLQAQVDYAEKYGLYWDAIYGMLYSVDENGQVVINAENFDINGNIRENSQLAQLLGTYSDRMGMSTWSSVLDNEETKRLGLYYKAFMTRNGADGNWADYWALLNPGGNDPRYAHKEQEIPSGLRGVLTKLELGIREYFGTSNLGLANEGRRIETGFKNFFGKLFGNEEWANATTESFNQAYPEASFMNGAMRLDKTIIEGFNEMKSLFGLNHKAAEMGAKTTASAKSNNNNYGTQNYGAVTENYNFNIGTVGENISLDDMVDKVTSAIKGLFTGNINSYKKSQ